MIKTRLRCPGRLAVNLLIVVAFLTCSKGTESQEGGNAEMGSSMEVREPAVAGAFYPGTEQALREEVSKLLDGAEPARPGGRIAGLIAPHAGYMYSGQVAAYAYRLVTGKRYDAVVIVAPSHRAYFKGSSIYTRGPYRTPLGLVEIDDDLAQAIVGSDTSIDFYPDLTG